MISQGSLTTLALFASVLLVAEFLLDLGWLAGSVAWLIRNDTGRPRITLRLAAAAIILHAIRVYIFVLGRTGPWIDFDVRSGHLADHSESWTWTGVYFAGIMATLGVIGVVVVWYLIRRAGNKQQA